MRNLVAHLNITYRRESILVIYINYIQNIYFNIAGSVARKISIQQACVQNTNKHPLSEKSSRYTKHQM